MKRSEKTHSLVIIDNSQKGAREKFLSIFWLLGGIIGNFDHNVLVRSGSKLQSKLRALVSELRLQGEKLDMIQFFGHGSEGTLYIDNEPIDLDLLMDILAPVVDENTIFWPRACAVFAGERGHTFAKKLQHLPWKVAGHTRIVSGNARGIPTFGSVFWQSGLYGLLPDQEPYWSTTDHGGSGEDEPNTVSIMDFKVPDWAWRERHKPASALRPKGAATPTPPEPRHPASKKGKA